MDLDIKEVWEKPTEFLWQYSMVRECDVFSVPEDPVYFFQCCEDSYYNIGDYQNVKPGDVVWVHQSLLLAFCEFNLPHIQVPFVLVISGNDSSFPMEVCNFIHPSIKKEQIELLINHPLIIHIFAQNLDYEGPSKKKLSHMPIGLDYHTIGYKVGHTWGPKASPLKQEAELKSLLTGFKPTYQRNLKAFVDFSHLAPDQGRGRFARFPETRFDICQILSKSGMIETTEKRVCRSELWAAKGECAFSVSPHGNGLDCHRTWEDLILGCIVIVKTGPLDLLYQDLPVVIVQDWEEVNKENMNNWLLQYSDAFTNPNYREKLTTAYWIKQFHRYADSFKQNF